MIKGCSAALWIMRSLLFGLLFSLFGPVGCSHSSPASKTKAQANEVKAKAWRPARKELLAFQEFRNRNEDNGVDRANQIRGLLPCNLPPSLAKRVKLDPMILKENLGEAGRAQRNPEGSITYIYPLQSGILASGGFEVWTFDVTVQQSGRCRCGVYKVQSNTRPTPSKSVNQKTKS